MMCLLKQVSAVTGVTFLVLDYLAVSAGAVF